MTERMLKVMVLAGGPDRERNVSLMSGAEVAEALRTTGHAVRQKDIGPGDLSALDTFTAWGGDVVFPVMHGGWGEGGDLQSILEERRFPFVGCTANAARLAMDKHRAKQTMQRHNLPTPAFELLEHGHRRTLEPPLVLKPPREGSSIDTVICHDRREATLARSRLTRRHRQLLAERYIEGLELTVSTLDVRDGLIALPTIQIVTAGTFYDYDAKYACDDTKYLFDIDLPPKVLQSVRDLSLKTHRVLGCRHLGRVDVMIDKNHRPWILELNTIPGFTTHSLLPMAAARAGIPMPRLVDHLVHLAAHGPESAPLASQPASADHLTLAGSTV